MTEMYFSQLRTGISEESIWKLCSLPYAIWFLWNLSRIFNGMPHCSIIPLIRARENGSAMACVNLWLKTLRLSLSCRHPLPILHSSLFPHSSFTSSPFFHQVLSTFGFFTSPYLFFSPPPFPVFFLCIAALRRLVRVSLFSQATVLWSIVCAFGQAHLNTFLSRLKRFRFLLSFLIKRDKPKLH